MRSQLLSTSAPLPATTPLTPGAGCSIDAGDNLWQLTASSQANSPDNIYTVGFGTLTGPSDFSGSNPMLAPLGYYGGTTQTMPPLPGSPALDAGNDAAAATLATDQRGYPRLSGAHVDIGAVEFQSGVVVTPTTPVPARCVRRSPPLFWMRAAKISFASNLSNQTILIPK